MAYLIFTQFHDTGKTKQFLVASNNIDLAELKWYAPWRRYCLFPFVQTIWDKNCLQEVQQKIDELMNERKVNAI
jgi:hypothetical protein